MWCFLVSLFAYVFTKNALSHHYSSLLFPSSLNPQLVLCIWGFQGITFLTHSLLFSNPQSGNTTRCFLIQNRLLLLLFLLIPHLTSFFLFAGRNKRWDLPFTTKMISNYLYRPETLFDFIIASLNSGITLIWKFFFITIIFSLSFILVEIQASNFSLSFECTKIYENNALLKFQSQSLSGILCFRYLGK